MPKHLGRSPISPRETTRSFISHHCGAIFRTRTGRPGDAPLRRVFHLSHETCTHNGKTAESQGRKRVFGQVLHKWHSPFGVVQGAQKSSRSRVSKQLFVYDLNDLQIIHKAARTVIKSCAMTRRCQTARPRAGQIRRRDVVPPLRMVPWPPIRPFACRYVLLRLSQNQSQGTAHSNDRRCATRTKPMELGAALKPAKMQHNLAVWRRECD